MFLQEIEGLARLVKKHQTRKSSRQPAVDLDEEYLADETPKSKSVPGDDVHGSSPVTTSALRKNIKRGGMILDLSREVFTAFESKENLCCVSACA